MTGLPTLSELEVIICKGTDSISGAVVLRNARSTLKSEYITEALYEVPFTNVTWIDVASFIIWLLVTIIESPLFSKIKPEPCCSVKNSLPKC